MTEVVDDRDSVREVPAEDGVTRQEAARRRARVVPSRLLNRRRPRSGAVPLVELLAVVPVLAMLGAVLGAPKMQLPDYWIIAPQTFNGDGSLATSTLLSYYNGHILAVPKILFWLNYQLNSGLNSTLGLWVLVMGVGQVLVMRALLPRGPRLDRWARSLLVVGLAVLVFAPQGTHNYVMAMSGASWILANLFTIGALWVVTSQRTRWAVLLAISLAALATVTYGTGLMAWPALVIVAILFHHSGRIQGWLIAAAVVATGSYIWFYERPTAHGRTGPDVIDVSRRTAQVLGSLLAPDADTAAAVGVVGVALAVFLGVRAVRADQRASAAWVGLVVYGFLGAVMIGLGRGGHDTAIGGEGRYAPVSAMFLCGLLVLAVWLWPKDIRVSFAAIVVVGVAFVGGRTEVDRVDQRNLRLEEVAIAARLGTVHAYPPAPNYAPNAYEESRAYMLGFDHYPFSDAFDSDCGMLGERLDMAEVGETEESAGTTGQMQHFLVPNNRDSVRMEGWVHGAQGVRCVLVVEDDLVVGAAVYGVPRPEIARPRGFGSNDVGFVAVAPAGMATYRVVAVVGSDQELVLLPGELRGVDAPRHPSALTPTDPLDEEPGTDDESPGIEAETEIDNGDSDFGEAPGLD